MTKYLLIPHPCPEVRVQTQDNISATPRVKPCLTGIRARSDGGVNHYVEAMGAAEWRVLKIRSDHI